MLDRLCPKWKECNRSICMHKEVHVYYKECDFPCRLYDDDHTEITEPVICCVIKAEGEK